MVSVSALFFPELTFFAEALPHILLISAAPRHALASPILSNFRTCGCLLVFSCPLRIRVRFRIRTPFPTPQSTGGRERLRRRMQRCLKNQGQKPRTHPDSKQKKRFDKRYDQEGCVYSKHEQSWSSPRTLQSRYDEGWFSEKA